MSIVEWRTRTVAGSKMFLPGLREEGDVVDISSFQTTHVWARKYLRLFGFVVPLNRWRIIERRAA